MDKATDSARASQHKLIANTPFAQTLIAGGLAGAVSRTAVAPLERLKIMYQVQHSRPPGVFDALTRIYRVEGIMGYFKGNWANCVRIFPNSAIKFYAYDVVSKGILRVLRTMDDDAKLTPVMRLYAGSIAGIVGMSATYPLDMVRGRLSVQTELGGNAYRGLFDALIKVSRTEGVGVLFRGWTPSVIGVIPYAGLNFGVYESLKAHLLEHYDLHSDKELSVPVRLGCGAIAGAMGQTFAYPFDVVRRRMQVEGWSGNTAEAKVLGAVVKEQRAYLGMTDAFRRTIAEEGVGALFKGLAPNFIKVVPSIAIAFVVYEQVKHILDVV